LIFGLKPFFEESLKAYSKKQGVANSLYACRLCGVGFAVLFSVLLLWALPPY
jgi:hypothetical protein